MNYRLWVNEANLRRVERSLWGAAASLLVILVLGGGSALVLQAWSKAEGYRERASTERANASKVTTDRGANLAKVEKIRSTDALQRTELAVDRAAAAEGVRVLAFESRGAPAPYISKYGSTTFGEGWTSCDVQVVLRGRAPGVERTLRKLAILPLPIEISALTMDPIADGSGEVASNVSFSLITRDDAGGSTPSAGGTS